MLSLFLFGPPAIPAAPPLSPSAHFKDRTLIVSTDNTGRWVRVALKPNDPARRRLDAVMDRAVGKAANGYPKCFYHRDVLLRAVGSKEELGICFGCNVAIWGPIGTTAQTGRPGQTYALVTGPGRDELIYLLREVLGVTNIPGRPGFDPAPRSSSPGRSTPPPGA